MNVIRGNIYGIDKTIQAIQTDLYEYLSGIWQGQLYGYGRAYRNIGSQNLIKPEVYVGNDEYQDVFLDDRMDASFFFLQGENDQTEDDLVFTSTTMIVFMVNLDGIFGKTAERNDSRAESDVIKGLQEYDFGRYSISSVKRGIGNIFRAFDTESIKFSDIHPYHCFAVEIELEYYTTDNCF